MKRLPATILALGLTSFFTDVGSEMIFPLLPLFLTQSLGAGPDFLGLVEGAADTVASLLKLLSGRLSDRMPRRKPLVVFGYGLAGAVRPLVSIAAGPWQVLLVRLADRVGKGVRSAPRDAMIADAAEPGEAGRAFGFHRAMDHAGAVVGPLVASGLLAAGLDLRWVFAAAAVPGALALAAVLVAREPPKATAPRAAPGAQPSLPPALNAYLAVLLLFSLANASDAFLLLRARELGIAAPLIPVLWSVLHVSKVVSAYLGGSIADRLPRVRVIASGWAVYAAVYVGLGLATGPLTAWALFVLYGAYYGLTEPAEKALVKDIVPAEARGRAFGRYNFVLGVSALPAGLITGALWRAFGGPVALGAGAAIAAIAGALLLAWATHRNVDRASGGT